MHHQGWGAHPGERGRGSDDTESHRCDRCTKPEPLLDRRTWRRVLGRCSSARSTWEMSMVASSTATQKLYTGCPLDRRMTKSPRVLVFHVTSPLTASVIVTSWSCARRTGTTLGLGGFAADLTCSLFAGTNTRALGRDMASSKRATTEGSWRRAVRMHPAVPLCLQHRLPTGSPARPPGHGGLALLRCAGVAGLLMPRARLNPGRCHGSVWLEHPAANDTGCLSL